VIDDAIGKEVAMRANCTFAYLIAGLGLIGLVAANALAEELDAAGKTNVVKGLSLTLVEKPSPPAATPAGTVPQKVLYLRWGNMRQGALSVARDRCCDLYDHVFVQGPDGALAPARKDNRARREHAGEQWVSIAAGKSDEEEFDPWHWVVKPEKPGTYEVWVEFAENKERDKAPAGAWTGKIVSNHVEVEISAAKSQAEAGRGE
jgi:hypothetical protein